MTTRLTAGLLALALFAALCPAASAITVQKYTPTLTRFDGGRFTTDAIVEYTCGMASTRFDVSIKTTYEGKRLHLIVPGLTSFEGARALAEQIVDALKGRKVMWLTLDKVKEQNVQGYKFTSGLLYGWEIRY